MRSSAAVFQQRYVQTRSAFTKQIGIKTSLSCYCCLSRLLRCIAYIEYIQPVIQAAVVVIPHIPAEGRHYPLWHGGEF